jgi:hypothetical protein
LPWRRELRPQVCALAGWRKEVQHQLFGDVAHGLCSIERHVMNIRRPPGLSARLMLRIAATGLLKNIIPKREKQKS